jgi:hypothetical protein
MPVTIVVTAHPAHKKAMKLIDHATGLLECLFCGHRHFANIKPNSNGPLLSRHLAVPECDSAQIPADSTCAPSQVCNNHQQQLHVKENIHDRFSEGCGDISAPD